MAEKRPPRLCSIEGCPGKHLARGWCAMHYANWLRHQSPFPLPRKPKAIRAKKPRRERRGLLTEEQAREIRRLFCDGVQQKHVAAIYSVSPSLISKVCRGLSPPGSRRGFASMDRSKYRAALQKGQRMRQIQMTSGEQLIAAGGGLIALARKLAET